MHYGKTEVVVCTDAADLGRRAASAVGDALRGLLDREEEVRMILAAGESQTTFVDALAEQEKIA